MTDSNPLRKKRWGLKKHRSDPHLAEERGRGPANTSLPPSRNESRGRSPGGFRGFLAKVGSPFRRSARSARQSPNPQPTAATSSVQDIPPTQITQDPSPLTTPTPEPNIEQSSNSGIAKAAHLDPKFVNERIADVAKGLAGIGPVPPSVQKFSSAPDQLQPLSGAIGSVSALLGPLKVFNDIANGLADVHPYAKVALSIFTCASKMILDQANRDDAVLGLLTKISDVYALLTEQDGLARIASMLPICGKIARQTLECADFVVHYSEMKSFWKRLGKHVFDETEAAIQSHSDVLDNLMQQFRDQMALTTVETVHRIAEDMDVGGMEYVPGAGRNTSKNCLLGTREAILSEIKCWIRSTGEDVQRVLWLSGTAGKGKSAIAHTIANWSHERGGMRACFCFDRTREAERRHEKIFTTIARDLADCDITMRGALACVVHDDNELKHTIDISRQWQKLVVGPTGEASKATTAPVLIIIDALDESGDPKSREQILRLLSGKADTTSSQPTELPTNVRIIVTSRPLQDICNALDTPHVRHIPMDIPAASTDTDIQLYVSTQLAGLCNFDDMHFKTLAEKSDGLFEWARLACEHIKGTNRVGPSPTDRFNAVIAGTSEKGTRLLDIMYTTILAEVLPEDERREAIPVFCSVMGQILASLEPLPMPALKAMRLYFPDGRDHYDVEDAIRSLGSLVTGIRDPQTPIRPLHASFYDFLTDESRSHDFFVDASAVQSDLAFASLRVMDSKHGLRFNICSLGNSYLPNSSIPDLETRIKESIPAELSYSCRFWGTHIGATSFESSLAKEVEAFFDGERLLWWLEALALMKSLRGSIDSLLSIANWVTGHAECINVSDATRDTLCFVRTFAATILRSTPHLYLSGLPFAPTQSRIFRKFAAKFPSTPLIVAGHVVNWPQMEKILHANDNVWSVAMSPDGKRIACGLSSGTIQVWDTETGEALCAPLRGHTSAVVSVAFSPNGKRIVSGSWDYTVRVWDAVTGKALGSPLKGHTSYVTSVAISSNGNQIVSGSKDSTIRVWDMKTGEAVGVPFQGHTDCVQSVAVSQDGKHIVSGSNDKTIRMWVMETGKAFGRPLEGHTASVQSVAISQDGKHIVSGSGDKTIRVWDMETGEALSAPLQGHTASVCSVTISLDGHRIVSGSSDQTIRVWDLKTGEALGSPLQGHTNSVLSVAISLDGNRIVSGSFDQTIRVWGADTIPGKASVAALQSHTDVVNSVAISPDGKRIVSGSDDETVRVWDMETGETLLAPLRGHTGSVLSVAISPDGKRIVSGSNDTTIWVWDMETGEALSPPLQGHTTAAVASVAISLDGTCIVSGSSDMIQVYNAVESGEASRIPLQLKGHSGILSVAISPDRNFIVSGSRGGTIWIWNVEAGKRSGHSLQGHTGWVRSVTVSPDTKCVVSGSDDMTVRVWDIGTGKALYAPLQGHTGWVRSVAISQNGQHIVSGSDDKTIRVWDMKTGEAVGAPFRGHTHYVLSVAISPDSQRVVSGSVDKTIRVWDLEFLNRHQLFEVSAICFSSDLSHALHSASSFLSDSEIPAPSGPNEEGWVVGPEGRLLLWIPPTFHPATFAQDNVLVIPTNTLQLDLSRVAHGTSWHECRTQEPASSSR